MDLDVDKPQAGAGAGHRDEGRALVASTDNTVGYATPEGYGGPVYGAPASEGGDNLAVTLRQYLYMVLKRKWLILSLALVFTVLGGLRTMLKTPLYTATARIQIEREPAKIVENGSTSPVEFDSSDFLRTQYELLKSRALAERVASSLRLGEDASFLAPRDVSLFDLLRGSQKLELPAAARQEAAAWIVLGNMTVAPVTGSRLADLSYHDPSPARAQQIANGYAEAYIASNLDKRFEANSYAKTFLDDQIKQLKIRLEELGKGPP